MDTRRIDVPGYVMDAGTKPDFVNALIKLENGFIQIMQQNEDKCDINPLIELVLGVIRQCIEHSPDELLYNDYDGYFKKLVIQAIMEKVGYLDYSYALLISPQYRVFLHLCLIIQEKDFIYKKPLIENILEIDVPDRMVIIELENKLGCQIIFDDDYDNGGMNFYD